MTTNIESRVADGEAVPYRGNPLPNVLEDLVILDVLDLDNGDERLWVPQAEDVSFRPLLFSVSHGYFVNLLRVRTTGVCLGTATPALFPPPPSGVVGTTSSTTGGPRRAATPSSRPATSTRWSSPKASKK